MIIPMKSYGSTPRSRRLIWIHLSVFIFIATLALFIFWPKDPWTPVELVIQGQPTRTWIADHPQKHRQGLQQHAPLSSNEAMLFIFDEPQVLRFWMPPTMKFSIDLVFLDPSFQVTQIYDAIDPCTAIALDLCERYVSPHNTLYALELPAGKASALQLKPGIRASILGLPTDSMP